MSEITRLRIPRDRIHDAGRDQHRAFALVQAGQEGGQRLGGRIAALQRIEQRFQVVEHQERSTERALADDLLLKGNRVVGAGGRIYFIFGCIDRVEGAEAVVEAGHKLGIDLEPTLFQAAAKVSNE